MQEEILNRIVNSLLSYQGNQETLMPVVETMKSVLGDDWQNALPKEIQQVQDEATRQNLMSKADHAIHYYGALSAWEEATSYLTADSVDEKVLEGRLPVLEYWLSLFGEEGRKHLSKVKDLLIALKAKSPVEMSSPIQNTVSTLNETVQEEIVRETTSVVEPADVQPVVEENTVEESSVEEKTEVVASPVVVDVATETEPVVPIVPSVPVVQEVVQQEEPINNVETEQEDIIYSQNWDIEVLLRQKDLYEDASSWVDAWCIRHQAEERTDYPHYGFIVDLLYDLKDKLHAVLDNQLLDEVVENDIEGGRSSLERLDEALDEQIDGLTDDFKRKTDTESNVSAKDILGDLDTSNEKEYIGKAPDGFEVVDNPYEVSSDEIKKNFNNN